MKPAALYHLIKHTSDEGLSANHIATFISGNEMDDLTRSRLTDWKNKLKFWEEYGKIYFNKEKALP